MRLVAVLVFAGCARAPAITPPDVAHHRDAIIDHTWPKPTRLPELRLTCAPRSSARPKSEADPRQVDELWRDELAVVTTDARHAVALLDHAFLAWQLARSERRPAAWDRAAAALQAAYDADPNSVEREAITSARANAAALRTSP